MENLESRRDSRHSDISFKSEYFDAIYLKNKQVKEYLKEVDENTIAIDKVVMGEAVTDITNDSLLSFVDSYTKNMILSKIKTWFLKLCVVTETEYSMQRYGSVNAIKTTNTEIQAAWKKYGDFLKILTLNFHRNS